MRLVLSMALIPMLWAAEAGGTGPAQTATPPATPLLSGTWGGDRIRVDGSAAGVRIQVDCFLVQLDKGVPLANGAFRVEATFTPMRPVALEGSEKRPPSQLTGRVAGDTLTLTIEPKDVEPAGTFILTRNGKATLPNCKMRS
jgi:hypothetical protein